MKKSVIWLTLAVGCTAILSVAGCQKLGADTSAADTTIVSEATATTTAAVPVTTQTTVVATDAPNNWDKVEAAGEPLARYEPAMVCGPANGKVYLFGGLSGNTALGDLYVYDAAASTWTQLNPVGPAPAARGGHTMVYDPKAGKIILFGGSSGAAAFGDTWAYDPAANTWTELKPSGDVPSARSEYCMAYDPGLGKTVLFGGNAGDGVNLNDTWTYDADKNEWKLLLPAGKWPPDRSRSSMVYDAAAQKMVLYSGMGWDGVVFRDMWTYDSAANVWTEQSPEGHEVYGRGGHAMVYHPGCKRVIMFGGQNHRDTGNSGWNYPNGLFSYDALTNKMATLGYADRVPFGRIGHAMVYEPVTGKIIMFGGEDEAHGMHSGTWTLMP